MPLRNECLLRSQWALWRLLGNHNDIASLQTLISASKSQQGPFPVIIFGLTVQPFLLHPGRLSNSHRVQWWLLDSLIPHNMAGSSSSICITCTIQPCLVVTITQLILKTPQRMIFVTWPDFLTGSGYLEEGRTKI